VEPQEDDAQEGKGETMNWVKLPESGTPWQTTVIVFVEWVVATWDNAATITPVQLRGGPGNVRGAVYPDGADGCILMAGFIVKNMPESFVISYDGAPIGGRMFLKRDVAECWVMPLRMPRRSREAA
jgi:hypothetical protein